MPKAFIKPLVKQVSKMTAKRKVSSAAPRLAGMRYKIPGTGEFKTIQNVSKDRQIKSARWFEFDDGTALKVDASEVHEVTKKFHGSKSIATKEAETEGSKNWRGKLGTQRTQDVKSIAEQKEYGSYRAAKIQYDAHMKEVARIGANLEPHIIIEQRGMYKIVPKVRAERMEALGELRIPKKNRGK